MALGSRRGSPRTALIHPPRPAFVFRHPPTLPKPPPPLRARMVTMSARATRADPLELRTGRLYFRRPRHRSRWTTPKHTRESFTSVYCLDASFESPRYFTVPTRRAGNVRLSPRVHTGIMNRVCAYVSVATWHEFYRSIDAIDLAVADLRIGTPFIIHRNEYKYPFDFPGITV